MSTKMKMQDVQVQRREPQPEAELTRDLPVATPAVDIYEYPERIVVLCDMPGVEPKNVDVMLENDVLTLTGLSGEDEPDIGEGLYRGFRPGVFRRTFSITADVDRAGIRAKVAHGVLTVELPKAAEAKPRKIEVAAE
ncbi:MAG: Hsp20/alpha crystallin family protein [Kiritimatiellia bacterium]|nr:Hsp20/alpha crystallin family protein [Kiritimatiellia bacterium]